MQIQIPFIELKMPDALSDYYDQMMGMLPDALKLKRPDILKEAKTAIATTRKFMSLLKSHCYQHPFITRAAEIHFFKVVKPRFHAHLIFWKMLFDIEVSRPMAGVKQEKKFLKKRLSALQDHFEKYKDFYTYYRADFNDRDEEYFTRSRHSGYLPNYHHEPDTDPLFSTSHDHVLASLLANIMLRDYLLRNITEIKSTFKESLNSRAHSSLQWTASKSGLVELVYALYSGGVFNHGKAMVSEIASAVQDKFDIKLVNYYHTFNELRLRKKNRTAFLENLREKLLEKMDELE